MAGMQAAFVDIGLERAGFLALREAQTLARETGDDTAISDCVREGDAVLVQVIKDPIGEKGARLSAGVTLPGRLLVMTPGQAGLALSRRIEDEAQRAALMSLGEQLLAGRRLRLIRARVSFSAPRPRVPALDDLSAGRAGAGARSGAASRSGANRPGRPPRFIAIWDRSNAPCAIWCAAMSARVLIDDAGAAEAARAYCRKAMPGAEALIETGAPQSVRRLRSGGRDRAPVPAASGAAVRRLDHHRDHRGAHRDRRQFRPLHPVRRAGRNQPCRQSGSGGARSAARSACAASAA